MGESKNKALVSLGMSCQTTHQLRRLTDLQQESDLSSELITPSGPFDWLICPPASAIDLLHKRIPEFTKSSIHIRKGRPYWADLNIYFWHSFLVTDQGERFLDIDATFEREIKRWRYLRDQFSRLDPSRTVFIISNTQNNLETEVFDKSERDQYHFTNTELDALRHSLAEYFCTKANDIHLEIVTREERSSGLEARGVTKKGVSFLPLDQNEWKGSKQSWNKWWQQLNQSLADQHSN